MNIRAWLEKVGVKYHSPHKFRHCHIQYGLAHSTSFTDFKAVSLNVMHSNTESTDQFYSVLNDSEVKDRIGALGKNGGVDQGNTKEKLIKEFLFWWETRK